MLTFEESRKLYESHVMNRRSRLKQLLNAYKGNQDILRKANRKGKKDAKIVHNFPRYISTIVTGYTGNVNYTKTEAATGLSDIFSFNSEASVNSDHLLFMSIYGESYELQWIDEVGKYCFEAIDPMSVMVITDGKIRESVTDAIVFDEDDLKDNKIKVTMTVYDDTTRRVYSYLRTKSAFDPIKSEINVSSFVPEDDEPHKIGACPVIQFKNNRWEQGDFEPIITMNDAYNLSVSNSVNDLTDNTDAMMVFRNLNATTKQDIADAKANGGFKVNEGGDVTWLVKNINDSYAENIKNRLDSDIHKLSFVPDMSDQNFANNASGVAIRYKLLGLEQIRLEKVKWMKKALFKRLQMISVFLTTKSESFDPLTIGITFKANLPQNSQEIAQFVQMLNGVTSKSTQLTQLGDGIVPNVKIELETIAQEQEDAANNGFVPAPVREEVTANGEADLLATKATGSATQSLQRE